MKKSVRTFIIIVSFIALTSFAVFFMYSEVNNHSAATVAEKGQLTGGTTTITIEYAVTPDEHMTGLSGRTGLAENHGLLFVFDRMGIYPFWMPEMKFAIDIIWIGEDKRIVYIKSNATPESYPASFKSSSLARYVLEVGTGNAEKWSWATGTQLSFRE